MEPLKRTKNEKNNETDLKGLNQYFKFLGFKTLY